MQSHSERHEPVGCGIVDAAAVGFDLERDAGRSEDLEQIPAVRGAERFAAAEGDIRNPGTGDVPRKVKCLVADEARRPRPCRDRTPRSRRCSARCSGWSAARQEKGAPGTQSTERPCIVNQLRISGEANVRLRHDLLGNILELGRLP